MKKWNEEEVEFLKTNYPKLTYKEICLQLGRSRKSIERKLTEINLIGLAKQQRQENKQSISKIGSRRRANNRYNALLSRTRGYENKKNKTYSNIQLLVSRQEFIEWFMPKDFEGASVDRIDKDGNYELSNMQVIPLIENIRKDKVKAKDGFCQCYKCKQIKPLELFVKESRRVNGYSTICLDCERERTRIKNKNRKR